MRRHLRINAGSFVGAAIAMFLTLWVVGEVTFVQIYAVAFIAALIGGLAGTLVWSNFFIDWNESNGSNSSNEAAGQDRDQAVVVSVTPSGKKLKEQLAHHAARAVEHGRRPYLYGCRGTLATSEALPESLARPAMQEALRDTYIICLDVDQWRSREAQKLLEDSPIALDACPVIYQIDEQGRPVDQLDAAAWQGSAAGQVLRD